MDKRTEDLVNKGLAVLERSAKAQENLLKIVESEQFTVEQGPPVCPSCGRMNPTVTEIAVDDSSGPLADFVMVAEVHCCNKRIYCVATGWDTFDNVELVKEFMSMKKGGISNGSP